eukprot:6621570-Pyramimonas_sp.AAC.2
MSEQVRRGGRFGGGREAGAEEDEDNEESFLGTTATAAKLLDLFEPWQRQEGKWRREAGGGRREGEGVGK